MKIIFAQGNPESDYAKTRHNIGFEILNAATDQLGANWQNKPKFDAEIAEVNVNSEKILFIKPNTYYNQTGVCIRKLIDFYKLEVSKDLLVIHDDLALPFGTIRVRADGSDGGNNGIKSINEHIGKNYHRIRVGIWNEKRDQIDDADFVLSKFNKDETAKLEQDIIPQIIDLIQKFISNSIDLTSLKI